MSNLKFLLNPTSVAIVGDSPGGGRGAWIHRQLVAMGFPGAIYPVNPKYQEIGGLASYPSLLAIPGRVDFVAVALGAPHALRVIRECAEKGVKAALFVASGFAEAGLEGQDLQQDLRDSARKAGIAVCGPNCYGVANFHDQFVAYGGPIAQPMKAGSIALVFQSGALTHAVTDTSVRRDTGYSYIVTTGNEAVTELSEYVAHIAADPETRVIACFIEGLRDPAGFVEAARVAMRSGTRIVVLKVGRSELAQQATLAHTGSLAGEDRVYDALFRKLGILRVHDIDELNEAVELLSFYPTIAPGNVALVSISGGGSGVMADLAQDVSLELAPFTEATTARLRAVLPVFATVNNPLDLTGAVGEDPTLLDRSLRALADDPAVALVALALNTPMGSDELGRRLYRQMASSLLDVARETDKPFLLFSMSSGEYDPNILGMAHAAGVPALQGMRETLAAIARAQSSSRALMRWRQGDDAPVRVAGGALERVREGNYPALTERQSKDILQLAGLTVGRERLAASSAEAVTAAQDLGFPVVMKVSSPDIVHKTDAGGVRVGLTSRDEVEQAHREILESAKAYDPDARVEGVLVAGMVGEGVDTIVGVSNEDGLGPAIVFGLGGVMVEALGDVAMRMAPLTPEEARDMVDETRAAQLLRGFRGSPPADVDRLVDSLVAVSRLAWSLRDEVAAIDINPLRVLPAGQGVAVLDALIVRKRT